MIENYGLKFGEEIQASGNILYLKLFYNEKVVGTKILIKVEQS